MWSERVLVSRLKSSLLLAGILLAAPLCAHAYNPFASISDYNAVIFGNASAEGGDTEGRLAVGGNLSAKWYSVGNAASADASKYSLVVGGNLNAEGKWQVFNGNTAYGGSLIAAPSTVSPYTVTNTNGVLDFAAIKTQMQSVSTYMSTMAGNGAAVYDGYSTMTLTGNNSTLNVFNLTADQAAKWASVSSRIIQVPAGSTAIINVSGKSGSLSNGMSLSGTSSTNVIFNYWEATSLDVRSMAVLGSLLAPNADLTLTSANINGTAVVNGSTHMYGGEYHNYGFSGSIPGESSVPEPSTLTFGCMALGIMIPLMRRRRV